MGEGMMSGAWELVNGSVAVIFIVAVWSVVCWGAWLFGRVAGLLLPALPGRPRSEIAVLWQRIAFVVFAVLLLVSYVVEDPQLASEGPLLRSSRGAGFISAMLGFVAGVLRARAPKAAPTAAVGVVERDERLLDRYRQLVSALRPSFWSQGAPAPWPIGLLPADRARLEAALAALRPQDADVLRRELEQFVDDPAATPRFALAAVAPPALLALVAALLLAFVDGRAWWLLAPPALGTAGYLLLLARLRGERPGRLWRGILDVLTWGAAGIVWLRLVLGEGVVRLARAMAGGLTAEGVAVAVLALALGFGLYRSMHPLFACLADLDAADPGQQDERQIE